ncbi:MAG TPA: hypothetical protein VMT91_11925 [Anaerolineales bacterium]|nr:hypothetical protein [Anaerolineales bacterium]
MKTIVQILSIARTEFRFGLRRGAPVITTFLIGLAFGAAILLDPLANLPTSRDDMQRLLQDPVKVERLKAKGLTVDFFRQTYAASAAEITVLSVPMAWPILLISTFLLLPAAAASSLPADRKFGVAELLHSLPLHGGVYLAGKILGFCLTVGLVALIPLGLFFGVLAGAFWNALQTGIPADLVWFFVKFALLDAGPMFTGAVMVGILAGTPFRTRRAAIFPGLAAGLLGLYFWLAVLKAPPLAYTQLDLNAYYLIQNYHSITLERLARASGNAPYPLLGASAPRLGVGPMIGMNILLVLGLSSLAALSRLWLKWKEDF